MLFGFLSNTSYILDYTKKQACLLVYSEMGNEVLGTKQKMFSLCTFIKVAEVLGQWSRNCGAHPVGRHRGTFQEAVWDLGQPPQGAERENHPAPLCPHICSSPTPSLGPMPSLSSRLQLQPSPQPWTPARAPFPAPAPSQLRPQPRTSYPCLCAPSQAAAPLPAPALAGARTGSRRGATLKSLETTDLGGQQYSLETPHPVRQHGCSCPSGK